MIEINTANMTILSKHKKNPLKLKDEENNITLLFVLNNYKEVDNYFYCNYRLSKVIEEEDEKESLNFFEAFKFVQEDDSKYAIGKNTGNKLSSENIKNGNYKEIYKIINDAYEIKNKPLSLEISLEEAIEALKNGKTIKFQLLNTEPIIIGEGEYKKIDLADFIKGKFYI